MSHKDSWFKFFIHLWRAGTRRLSFEAKGLYVDLIVLWRDGQRVPNDPGEIAAELGIRDRRTVARPLGELLLRGKITVDEDGFLHNGKVESDMEFRAEQRAHRPSLRMANEVDQGVLKFGPRIVHNRGDK